jgi:hypothetical protein
MLKLRMLILVLLAAVAVPLMACSEDDKPQPPKADDKVKEKTPKAEDKVEGNWGTIKGRVVFAGDKIPERLALNVTVNQKECLKNGPILSEAYVINKKNKGVRWAVVWLIASKDPKEKLEIHPSLKELKDKEVVVDQPCCAFEPRVVVVREGQTLVIKNSAEIPHNFKMDSPSGKNPSINPTIPPGSKFQLPDPDNKDAKGLVAEPNALPVRCTQHPWMECHVRVYNHPYFAVTDEDGNFEIKNAPARACRLVVWQESKGWVVGEKDPDKFGIEITIKKGETTDLGKVELKPDEKKD